MKKYFKRIYDKILNQKLETFGAVWVIGPKFCGKTRTSEMAAKSVIKINSFNENDINYVINSNPLPFLNGIKPKLIDEWQLAPHIWDIVKIQCDENSKPGNFILTGSTSVIPNVSHSGNGRIASLQMYPMSLFESGESNGTISLIDLFDKKYHQVYSELTLEKLIFAACRGGWPQSLTLDSPKAQLDVAKSYFEGIYTRDIKLISDFNAKPVITKSFLQAYARNISTLAKDITICKGANITHETFENYLNLLQKLFIVEELEPFPWHLRSKSAIRQGNKREFVDPSIAAAALKATPKMLMNDLNTFGLIFETLCIRDLKVYANSLGAECYYFRDKTGLECDCILQLNDGRYCLIEIKLGTGKIGEGIKNLNKLEELIVTYNANEENKHKLPLPSFKMVLTNLPCSSVQDKGVLIIPIGCLKD